MHNKKKIIIISSLVAILIIIAVILVIVLNNNSEKSTASSTEIPVENTDVDTSESNTEGAPELPGKVLDSVTISDSDDLSQLEGYDSVYDLTLLNSDISDFSFLSDINVRSLFIRENKAPVDLSFVNGTYLTSLRIVLCEAEDWSIVSKFKNLEIFEYIYDTPTAPIELGFLSKCTNLQEIRLQNISFTDCSFVKNMDKLQHFSAERSGIKDLSPFKNCKSLQSLVLKISAVSDLSPLKDLKLNTLYVEESMVTDVSPLKKMSAKTLNNLSLRDNYITDVSPLKKSKNFTFIDLSSNMISEFPSHLIAGGYLDLSYNNISYISDSDISKLNKYKTTLNLFDNLLDEDTFSRLDSLEFLFFSTWARQDITLTEAMEYTKKMKEILGFCDKGSDEEKVFRAIYYICQNTKLDIFYEDTHKDDAYGALFSKAVCGGTTDLTGSLCKHMGIKASRNHGDFETSDDNMLHVWNVVNIGGQYYHCDAMQSIGFHDSNGIPDIVLVSDEDIKTYGHLLIAVNIPNCKSSLNEDLRAEIIESILSEQ